MQDYNSRASLSASFEKFAETWKFGRWTRSCAVWRRHSAGNGARGGKTIVNEYRWRPFRDYRFRDFDFDERIVSDVQLLLAALEG